MRAPNTGGFFRAGSGALCARVIIGGTAAAPLRVAVTLATDDEGQAQALARCIAGWAARMRRAGYGCDCVDPGKRGHKCGIVYMAKQMASGELAAEKMEAAVCSLEKRPLATAPAMTRAPEPATTTQPEPEPVTFIQFAQRWTSGELRKQWPLHIEEVKRGREVQRRLALHVPPGIAHKPIAAFTLDDAEEIVRTMSDDLAVGTRVLIGSHVRRVVTLAVYPARLLATNPIPKGWLPAQGDPRARPWLYPTEEAQLLAHTPIPVARRVYFGFMCREGMRKEEGLALAWSDLDLEHGTVRLDKNKTKTPRVWRLDPSVARALATWKRIKPDPDSPRVFPDDAAWDGAWGTWPALEFRNALQAAGLTRAELFEDTKERGPLRIHDTRTTFVTLALGCGRGEPWCMARTGHTTSSKLRVYDRAVQRASELDLGWLLPLDECIPELRDAPPPDSTVKGNQPEIGPSLPMGLPIASTAVRQNAGNGLVSKDNGAGEPDPAVTTG